MFRISLRRLLLAFLGCAFFLAIFGLLFNGTRLVQVLFNSGDLRVVIESSHVNPRGTFFEVYRGNRSIVTKQRLSSRRIKASEFETHEYNPSEQVIAYHYENRDPKIMDVLLLVDFEQEAYAIYWAGCRADKCQKLDWKTWDGRCKNFEDYVKQLSE